MALSANASREFRGPYGQTTEVTLNTGVTCYRHALLATAPGDSSQALIPANSTTQLFAGIAVEPVGQQAFPWTGNGSRQVTVRTDCQVLLPLRTDVTAGLVGSIMYANSDDAVTSLATIGPQVGRLVKITTSSGGAGGGFGWVHLGAPALSAAS